MTTGFRSAAMCFCMAVFVSAVHGAEPLKVETKGVSARILYEAPISGGHLPELKGKYKLRITEISIAPGGLVGDHNHLGPGIRQMTVGEMEYIMPHMTTTYRAGDYFFETGDISHRVINKSGASNTHLLFEILPADLAGASLILPRDNHPK
jgi:quercetin dioxygenase-like cupin family protein